MSSGTAELLEIEVEAFRCFAETASLSLKELPAGLHLVRGRNLTNDRLGSNGAGKSTFFSDAPTWCLSGRTVGGLRTTDLQSWLTKTRPRVALTIRRGEAEHVVARGPRAADLTIDGRAASQEDVSDLVGVDYATWSQAVVWDQGAPQFFDLPPAAKMDLLSEALGLERWERRAQAAAARARRLEERRRAAEGELRGLATAREHAEAALSAAREAATTWGRDRAARAEAAAAAAVSARERAELIDGRRGEASMAADAAGLKVRERAMAETEARRAADAAQSAADAIVPRVAELHARIKKERAQLAVLEARRAACPTCGHALTAAEGAALARPLRASLASAERDHREAERRHGEMKKAAWRARDAATAREAEERAAEEDERHASGELRLLDRELGAARATSAAADEAQRAVESEENPHRAAAREARARIREVADQVKEGEKLEARLAASAERARFWARGFRDIRLEIIDVVLEDLRGTTAEALSGLGMGDWEVDYVTERETKSGTTQRALTALVRAPGTDSPVRWERIFGGGERQRLRLAGTAALSEVLLAHAGVAIDFRVLDEPTRGLSPEGVVDLVEMLGKYARSTGLRIFFIDHMAIDGAGFAGTNTVERSESGARLVEA